MKIYEIVELTQLDWYQNDSQIMDNSNCSMIFDFCNFLDTNAVLHRAAVRHTQWVGGYVTRSFGPPQAPKNMPHGSKI